jgi:outer membrane protein assembly factor BamB
MFLRSSVSRFCLFLVTLGLAYPVLAQRFDGLPSEKDAERLGLVIQWQAAGEKSPTAVGQTKLSLWPHRKERQQILTVKVGERVVERIDANQRVTLTSAQGSTGAQVADPSGSGSLTKKLGMEAARKQAELIVARYARLGRKAVIEEVDRPLNYLLNASNDGAIQAMNGETGELFWTTFIGASNLPTVGPGVNDHFVAATNGNDLYVLELATGRLLGKKRMNESASAPPLPVDYLVYVPTIGGAIAAYEGTNLEAAPVTMRFTGAINSPVVPSLDGSFVAWPDKNSMYIAQAGRRFAQWNRLDSSLPFRSAPQATADGFVIVSSAGMVFRVNLQQTDSLLWRENLAAPVSAPPVIVTGLILVTTDNGDLVAMEDTKGQIRWVARVGDIRHVLMVSESRVYAQRAAGQLVVLDRRTGETVAALEKSFARGVVNTVNDRMLLQAANGSIVCLREPQALNPTPTIVAAKATSDQPPSGAAATPETPDPGAMPSSDPFAVPADPAANPLDPFGAPPAAGASSTDDQFGSPEPAMSAPGGDNPF